jgi:tetratricopeptide (TPR) repeat protein
MQLAASACGDGAQPAAISAELTGCDTIYQDGVCAIAGATSLKVWVPDPWSSKASFHLAGAVVEPSETLSLEGGKLVKLAVDTRASSLEVRSQHDGLAGAYRVALQAAPWLAVHRKAEALITNGDLEAAVQVLQGARRDLTGLDLARATGLLARVELARGQYNAAVLMFREALALDRKFGLLSREVDDACALAFLLSTRLHRFDEAQLELERARASALELPEGRARLPYFEALIDFELGDLRRALLGFRTSHRLATRLGLTRHARTASDRRAAVLQALGRTAEAIAVLSALRQTPSENGCENSDVLINLAWFQIESSATSPAPLREARSLLEQALGLFPAFCADPFRRAVAETNLAFVFIGFEDASRARVHLASARAAGDQDVSLTVWWQLLEAHIARLDHELAAAAEQFSAAASLAESLALPDLTLRALLGLGETLEQRGAHEGALDAYARSEAILDRQVLNVPLGEGRAAFLALHDASAKAEIALSLALSQPERAFAVARNARARALRAIASALRMSSFDTRGRAQFRAAMTRYQQQREALVELAGQERELPIQALAQARKQRRSDEAGLLASLEREVAELAALRPQAAPSQHFPDLTLLFHPLREGWVAFARDERGLSTHLARTLTDDLPVAVLTKELLAPFDTQIARTGRVHVLTQGLLDRVDFHALPFRGKPLIEHAQVSYPLDLQAELSAREPVRGSAVVIADPSSDLPSARDEAGIASDALATAGLDVTLLTGDAATTDAVTNAIARASHVHFAGHAVASGQDGWQSVLALARGETISIADVLTSQTAARSVVLSSCDAAKGAEGELPVLSIGAAFAIAGAQAVIAPTRPVADAEAAALVSAMYAYAADHDSVDWAEALQAAQRERLMTAPTSDWSAFRVLTR